ncbi:MAG: Acetyltransferase (GNAT) family protein [Candidatus Methanofastidiosum methylothiophilum]|uniref:Acetyltransferase (GNAT) family protein n=1 Tax=Candidatus Methanofastidiosum methylothiophilum TaxID=1705564 RepID=A0A150IYL2_9EURY|nr:MAG: Acetyltransferase (GNAT) family protein [Candidatus Methanofastidiosum methylthiophilus]NMC77118.1 GNAT family N-acetyltransferase [Candidatus Methanofastidiosa archaeon]
MNIRRAQEKDLPKILELNNIESKWVGKKEIGFFQKYMNISFFSVIEDTEKVVGFLMAMDHDTDYDSINFLWFKNKFRKYYYIDRVIVDESMRGKGIASMLYKEVIDKKGPVPLVAEVAIKPSNESSVKFHDKVGFKEVGTLTSDGKKVRMYYLD